MKTTTIFDAWLYARDYVESAQENERTMRQATKFYAALLSRIEAGDRAREALQQIEQNVGPVALAALMKKP